jgi:2-oxoglutarate dehydrogenase E2 component (dihydrolipoamide succinyltransferase)
MGGGNFAAPNEGAEPRNPEAGGEDQPSGQRDLGFGNGSGNGSEDGDGAGGSEPQLRDDVPPPVGSGGGISWTGLSRIDEPTTQAVTTPEAREARETPAAPAIVVETSSVGAVQEAVVPTAPVALNPPDSPAVPAPAVPSPAWTAPAATPTTPAAPAPAPAAAEAEPEPAREPVAGSWPTFENAGRPSATPGPVEPEVPEVPEPDATEAAAPSSPPGVEAGKSRVVWSSGPATPGPYRRDE